MTDLEAARRAMAAAIAEASIAADKFADACAKRMHELGAGASQDERSDLGTDRRYAAADAKHLRTTAASWGWKWTDE